MWLHRVTWKYNMGFEIAYGLKSKKLPFSARRFFPFLGFPGIFALLLLKTPSANLRKASWVQSNRAENNKNSKNSPGNIDYRKSELHEKTKP